MPKFRIRATIALSLLAAGLSITAGTAQAVSSYTAQVQSAHTSSTIATSTTWHVIAGFSQLLPSNTGDTEAVN
jgi:hypothetical protein